MTIEKIRELCHAEPFRLSMLRFPLEDLMLISDITIKEGRSRRTGKH